LRIAETVRTARPLVGVAEEDPVTIGGERQCIVERLHVKEGQPVNAGEVLCIVS